MAKNYPYEVIILCVLAKGMDCSGKITESTGVFPVEMSQHMMFNSLVNLDLSNIESQYRMLWQIVLSSTEVVSFFKRLS